MKSIQVALLLLCLGVIGCNHAGGDAQTARPIGTSYVTFTNSHSLGKVDYVLIVIYDNTTARPVTDKRISDRNGGIELKLASKNIPNIRGTNKVYVLRGDDVQIHELATTSETAIESASVTPATDADQYLDTVLAKIAKDRPELKSPRE